MGPAKTFHLPDNPVCTRRPVPRSAWSLTVVVVSVCLSGLAGCQPDSRPAANDSTPTPDTADAVVPASSGKIVDRYPGEPAISSVPLNRQAAAEQDAGKFVYLDAEATGIDFSNIWEPGPETYYALGTSYIANGVAIGDYDADGRPDIYLTRQQDGGRLYRNLGNMKFEDVTTSCGIDPEGMWSAGAAFVDLTNDGHLDLYVYGYGCPNRLYVNNGNGQFEEQAARYGLDYDGASVCAAYGDYDQDGDLDVYLVTNRLDGNRTRPVPGGGSPTSKGPNGELILNPNYRERFYLLSRPDGETAPEVGGEFDHLYRNDGDRFVDVSLETNIGEFAYLGLSANWWDYDNDGRLDLYVANDFKGPDLLYRNNGPNRSGQITFSDVIPLSMPHTPWFSMGSDFADINHDGLVDYLASDMAGTTHYRDKLSMGAMSGPDSEAWFLNWPNPPQYMRNCLFLNTGGSRFMEVAVLAGLSATDWTWTVKFDDFDNDGNDDVYITNGMSRDSHNGDLQDEVRARQLTLQEQVEFWWDQPRFELENLAFRNTGGLKFENVSQAWGLDHAGVSTGAATADLDGDGDLDLVVNGFGEAARLYRNELGNNNAIELKFRGAASNRDGLGVRVDLVSGPDMPVQTKWLAAGRGFASSSDLILHFGTGEATEIEQIRVTWPSGLVQTFESLPANHLYTIVEKGEIQAPVSSGPMNSRDAGPPMFEPYSGFRNVRHIERPFDDFQREPLLPNRHSQLGPGIAWGDVDGDGDQDFWLGQAAGTAGQLFINDGQGGFKYDKQQVFSEDAECEDLGAALVDVDNDGDVDLYVASGSVECEPGDPVLSDRLYLNDGRGQFADAPPGSLPDLRNSGSVVAPTDFDRDGDVDLFVGSRIVPGAYPTTPDSAFLVNEGGTFVDATDQLAPELKSSGMVTSAVWADTNDDGWQDLIVSYDWGSPRLFVNQQGRLVDYSEAAGLTGRLGWFTSVSAGDIDNDGDLDFVLGNFGLNTKYKASPEKPELLYYGDFENNGKKQIVEAKYENGVCLPRRGLGCTSDAMPTVKQKLPTYHEFAISSLTDIYTSSGLDAADKYEVNYLSSCLLVNNGVRDGVPQFEFRELPRIVQASPVFGSTLTDVDGDGNLDLYVVQNFHGPQRETGNMDGGVSLLLSGDGRGQFEPVWPNRSGLFVPGDATALTVADLNQDQRPDFLVGVNNGNPAGFVNQSHTDFVCLRLDPGQNRTPLGSQLSFPGSDGTRRVMQITGGGSYLSQSPAELWLAADRVPPSIDVRWPDGSRETFTDLTPVSGRLVLQAGQGSKR